MGGGAHRVGSNTVVRKSTTRTMTVPTKRLWAALASPDESVRSASTQSKMPTPSITIATIESQPLIHHAFQKRYHGRRSSGVHPERGKHKRPVKVQTGRLCVRAG